MKDREKGKKYSNQLISPETSDSNDSAFAEYLLYTNVYSNTPNFKGSLSITNNNSIIDKVSSTLTLKMTSPFDFVSGFFSATKEGKGTIPPSNSGMSWFRNPGQIGGELYADLDILYDYSNQIYFGLFYLIDNQVLIPKLIVKQGKHQFEEKFEI